MGFVYEVPIGSRFFNTNAFARPQMYEIGNAGRNILTIPLFPAMVDGDVDRVVGTLMKVLHANLKP